MTNQVIIVLFTTPYSQKGVGLVLHININLHLSKFRLKLDVNIRVFNDTLNTFYLRL